jgi:hypothetical protein
MTGDRALSFGIRFLSTYDNHSYIISEVPYAAVIPYNMDTLHYRQGQMFAEYHQPLLKTLNLEAGGSYGYISWVEQAFGSFQISLNQAVSTAQIRFSAAAKAIPTNPVIKSFTPEGSMSKPVLAMPLQLSLFLPSLFRPTGGFDSSPMKVSAYHIEYKRALEKVLIPDSAGRYYWNLSNLGAGFCRGVEASLRLYHRSGLGLHANVNTGIYYLLSGQTLPVNITRQATTMGFLFSHQPLAGAWRWGARGRLSTRTPDDLLQWSLRRQTPSETTEDMVLGTYNASLDRRVFSLVGAFGEWRKAGSRGVLKVFGSIDYSPFEPYQGKRQWIQNPHSYYWQGELGSISYSFPAGYIYYLYPYFGLEVQF